VFLNILRKKYTVLQIHFLKLNIIQINFKYKAINHSIAQRLALQLLGNEEPYTLQVYNIYRWDEPLQVTSQ